MTAVSEVRPSPIAGTWYAGDPERLARQVDASLDQAVLPPLPGAVIGVIAPHAGHRYSGQTAGHAFAALRGQSPEVVAVVSPMHAPAPGAALTSAHQAYATPLGKVRVDRDALATLDHLLSAEGLDLTPVANDSEHSLEIELPFLQRALSGDWKLLPLMLRSQQPLVARRVGHALAQTLRGRSALLVASTDLSHFYPEEMARELDGEMLRCFAQFAPDEIFTAERTGKGFACGAPAVAAVLWAARELGADTVEILHYSTSGDQTGDRSSVVGYGAAAILKRI